jgi:DNA-directed RNA polymerase specialized sigma24 family protein
MSELVQATERAVLRLKAIERKVVVKHYLYWQPVEVSARYCHMSPGRFRTLLHRARRSISVELEDLGRYGPR